MVLIDKLWDDTMAGPQPERGLGKLRKMSTQSQLSVKTGNSSGDQYDWSVHPSSGPCFFCFSILMIFERTCINQDAAEIAAWYIYIKYVCISEHADLMIIWSPVSEIYTVKKMTYCVLWLDGEGSSKYQRSLSMPSNSPGTPTTPGTPVTPPSTRKENVWRSVFHPGSNSATKGIGADYFDKPQPNSPTVYDWYIIHSAIFIYKIYREWNFEALNFYFLFFIWWQALQRRDQKQAPLKVKKNAWWGGKIWGM